MSSKGQADLNLPRIRSFVSILEKAAKARHTAGSTISKNESIEYNSLLKLHKDLPAASDNKRLQNTLKLLYLGYLVKNGNNNKSGNEKWNPSANLNSNSRSSSATSTLYSPKALSRSNSFNSNSFSSKIVRTPHGTDVPSAAGTEYRSNKGDKVVTRQKESTWVSKYTQFETKLLQNLESLISLFDNFIIVQNLFKSSRLSEKFKLLEKVIKNLSKFYLVIILINLKNLILKLVKINKLIRYAELESSLMSSDERIRRLTSIDSNQVDENGNPTQDIDPNNTRLVLLYTEKFKTFLEIVGYSSELILNLNMIYPSYKLPKLLGKLVNAIAWIISLYRLSKDEHEDESNNAKLDVISEEYNV
ncbi:hypothetical protein CANARDRAFT_19858 [[Candida] arabinofermentans NRRL YB-2248]|uniref:Uncharacterized protein n=1 Tax=[Candida] arabinofermentans NRRL YB-2248 TaxID=983967 RepID=A0A1E4SU42_9ASCO|nr:hypothetical protein CANARDRAFT_19858 [[Candida] arabinofermentans NRRL YB-2248]